MRSSTTDSGSSPESRANASRCGSRRGALFRDRFPRIAEAVGAVPVANALIDGEAVVFLLDGHSDFAGLLTKAGGERASFVAFDLLDLEADDLRQRPLEERRDTLARLVRVGGIVFSEALATEGAIVFAHARASSASRGSCLSGPAATLS